MKLLISTGLLLFLCCCSNVTLLSSQFWNSTLFSSSFVQRGKSVLRCKPHFSQRTVIDNQFYFANGIAQVDGKSSDDQVISILLTFGVAQKIKWNRLTIVIGIPGSPYASFNHSQDIFTPTSLAIIQNRSNKKFCFGKLFDVLVSLPKAGLVIGKQSRRQIIQLPANKKSYFIELYFDNNQASSSKKKSSTVHVADCVRIEHVYKIDFVPVSVSLPSIIYSLEPIEIRIFDFFKYFGGPASNFTTIVGELTRLDFLQTNHSSISGGASCSNITQRANLRVSVTNGNFSFSVPLCDPATWQLYALLPDKIHYFRVEFFVQSRVAAMQQSDLLPRNVSLFIETAAMMPLSGQLETMNTLINAVPTSFASNGSSNFTKLLTSQLMQRLLSLAASVDPTSSALALANVVLLVQSFDQSHPNISSLSSSASLTLTTSTSTSTSGTLTLSQHINNYVSFERLTETTELDCDVKVIAKKLFKLRSLTRRMLKLVACYPVLVLLADVPGINYVVAAGVLIAVANYVNQILKFVDAERTFRQCHADCGIAEDLPWPNREYLQAGQAKAITDLLVISESFSTSPDGCYFKLYPTLFVELTVVTNDVIKLLNALPADVRTFTGIDFIATYLTGLSVPGRRSESYLTAANILSINSVEFLPVVQCHSTAVSNIVLCDPGYGPDVISTQVPLVVTYVLDSQSPVQQRIVFADVTAALSSPTPAAQPTAEPTLKTELCVTEIVGHSRYDPATGVSKRFTVRPSTIGTYCCSQMFPDDPGSFCLDGGSDIDVTPSQIGVWTSI
eukprot:gene35837-46520_t